MIKYINGWALFLFWFFVLSVSFLYFTDNIKIRYVDDNKSDINIYFIKDK